MAVGAPTSGRPVVPSSALGGVPRERGRPCPRPAGARAPAFRDSAGQQRITRRSILTAAALFVVWVICNPYFEIDHSSLIYAGRILADLDPSGVGRDAMFRFDGQSSFTVFTGLNRLIVRWTDLPTAMMAISALSVAAAFCAASSLALTVADGRARLLAILYAAALPAYYGGYKIFSYAETATTPRPFAEALVMLGAAALVRGRRDWAAAAMAGATLLHPIMALPGVLLLIAWVVVEDPRWLAALALFGAVALCGGALHVAVLDRLTDVMDPSWQAVLESRNPHLFPSLWPGDWVGRLGVRAATVIIAASLTRGPVRKVFLLALAVGVAGFATAYLLNERLPLVLLVQAQTWRTLWLVFALAPIAAAICTVELWDRGDTARVALALLACSWIFADSGRCALLLAGSALAVQCCIDPDQIRLSRRSAAVILAGAALLALAGLAVSELSVLGATDAAPPEYAEEARRVIALDWDDTPIAVLAALVMMRKRGVSSAVLAAIAIGGALVALATWDRRSAQTLGYDTGIGEPALARSIATRPGEVFWVGGVQEAWRWLKRPNWVSPIQGAGLVFSRRLAMRYQDRARRAWDAGLDDGALLQPLDRVRVTSPPPLDETRLKAFCSAPDAPAWIVRPSDGLQGLSSALAATPWTAAHPRLEAYLADGGATRWRWTSRFEVAACAGRGDAPVTSLGEGDVIADR